MINRSKALGFFLQICNADWFMMVVMCGAVYIELEDLLHQFSDPNVMDVKMGTRSATVACSL